MNISPGWRGPDMLHAVRPANKAAATIKNRILDSPRMHERSILRIIVEREGVLIRLLLCLVLITGAAMAAPLEAPNYDPMRQVPTPDGTFKDRDAPPTDGEVAEWMWKRFAGDKPMPPHLRQKYGLPPDKSGR